jgi:hypothetical protein
MSKSSDQTTIDGLSELEFQGRYREGAGAPDLHTSRAIAWGVQEIERLRAEIASMKELTDAN